FMAALVFTGVWVVVIELNFGSGAASLLAGACSVLAALKLAAIWLVPRQTTEAWRKGADGELLTAQVLSKLPPSYVTLHDLPMPGSKANIDHLVIGPTGAFTVETKNYSEPMQVSRGSVQAAGRTLAPVVEQAKGQASAVSAALGQSVLPIVCAQGAGIDSGLFSKRMVNGVQFCIGRRLNDHITSGIAKLSAAQVEALAEAASERFKGPTRAC
ncbi:MAG TPA: nuclease-related domain-containing protein, partial [Actinomycetota bacterium]|nr:nuclease-related domain-containing protein [Actinomycetota bacterium]